MSWKYTTESVDARLYVAFAATVSVAGEEPLVDLLGAAMPVICLSSADSRTEHSGGETAAKSLLLLENVLLVVLAYVTPTAASSAVLAPAVSGLIEGVFDNRKEADKEEVLNEITSKFAPSGGPSSAEAVLRTAHDIRSYAESYSRENGFNFTPNEPRDVLFAFTKARVLRGASYANDVNENSPFFALLAGFPPFEEWYSGIIGPFSYYWDNYGSISENSVIASDFLRLDTFSSRFEALISPLAGSKYSEKTSVQNWCTRVLLPLVYYHNKDLTQLLEWLYEERDLSVIHKYQVWNSTIKAIVTFRSYSGDQFEIADFSLIVEFFLAGCYYYAVLEGESSTSVETLQIYDLIRETLIVLETSFGEGLIINNFQIDLDQEYDSLKHFIRSPKNSLRPLFTPNKDAIATLNEAASTCERLYATNKLTLCEFLRLKYSDSGFTSKEKEITTLLSGVNATNYSQLLKAARLFSSAFIDSNPEHAQTINKLIVSRFLLANLFDAVGEFYDQGELNLSTDTFFELTSKKFWTSYNLATNLNDKIGRLHEASQCFVLYEKYSRSESLSETHRGSLIKTRHLLKAISNMKNFKIVVDKGKPFTPARLISKFGSLSDENTPLHLISTILEQNPKAYLAYEKLYKILNDLLIFFEDSETSQEYLPLLKATCIEAALVDNNFDFAFKHCKELFEHYGSNGERINEIWLTFYQVGKYVSMEWFGDYDAAVNSKKIEILLKQREILSLLLKKIKPTDLTLDNSRQIARQFTAINAEIGTWYETLRDIPAPRPSRTNQVGAITSEIVSDATATTNQASEKLSNLFVSGLGWAIGANP